MPLGQLPPLERSAQIQLQQEQRPARGSLAWVGLQLSWSHWQLAVGRLEVILTILVWISAASLQTRPEG